MLVVPYTMRLCVAKEHLPHLDVHHGLHVEIQVDHDDAIFRADDQPGSGSGDPFIRCIAAVLRAGD